MTEETPRERLAYWLYRGLERVAMSVPETAGRALALAGGRLAFRALDGVRLTVERNQAMVLGEEPGSPLARSAAREAFELYARYWFDTFRLRTLPPEEIKARTEIVGIERIDRALERGRGCITALPHMGNWDLAGAWLAVNGYRIVSVAEELRPRRLAELFLRHREALGMRIIPLAGDGHVGQQLARLLSENWIVALVADRDLSGRGVPVEMFGSPRRLPAGPALLSLSTGAPLMVCPVYTRPAGWRIEIGEPLSAPRTRNTREDVATLTRLMAREFERAIAACPVDWHMFQPAWER